MPDIALDYGSDISLGPTGDLALSDGPQLTQDRLLRRLLTSPRSYLWHLQYGAGLPAMLGKPVFTTRIKAIIRAQVLREATVARNPPPVIDVTATTTGLVYATIKYADAKTGAVQTISGPIDGLNAGG